MPRPGPGSSGHRELWFNPKPRVNLLFPESGIFRVTSSRMDVVPMPLPGWPGDDRHQLRAPRAPHAPGVTSPPRCWAVLLSWGAGGPNPPARERPAFSGSSCSSSGVPTAGSGGRWSRPGSELPRLQGGLGPGCAGAPPGVADQLAAGAGSLRGDTHPPRGCCLRWAQLGHLRAPPGDRELWGWAVASRAHAESPLGGEDSLDVEVTGAPLAPTAGKAAQLGWPAGAQAARTEAAFRRAASVRRAEGGQAGLQQTRVYITPFPGWTPRPSYVTPGRASRPHEGFGGPCSDPGGPGPSRWPGLSTPPPFLSPRANFDDTATYSAVATNGYGQVSTNAAVVVRREWSSGGGGRPPRPPRPPPAPLTRLSRRVPRRRGAVPLGGTPHRT